MLFRSPPLLLWIAVLYLCRAITLPIAVGVSHFAGVNADALSALKSFWSVYTLLPSLPAASILIVLFRRVPTASKLVRWIWARGKRFLVLAAVLDLGLSLISLIKSGDVDNQLPSIVTALIDVYFLFYIALAQRCTDTFAEFPLA